VEVHHDADTVVVEGRGLDAFVEPSEVVDCGNSGTTMRMLAGLVAGRPFRTVLTGDDSLCARPMARVIEPLRVLGARIDGAGDGRHAPLEIDGGELAGRTVTLQQASGQVKTALVLAALQAHGVTEIVEPAPSRDHTERMLAALDVPIERVDPCTLRVERGAPRAFELDLPGDPSSAAFLAVAAAITPGSDLVLDDVLLNPGRIAFLDVLSRMGAAVAVTPTGERLGEPVGTIAVRPGPLHGTVVECREPIIDEVPALAIAGAFAEGITEFRDAAELRVKESDRVLTVVELLAALGVGAEPRDDGLVVRGGTPGPATLRSHGDHRIALAAAVAANAAAGTSTIEGWSAVDVSYPGFLDDLAELTRAS
jgi:3-phosphoshikimate 1-carboxyvinyltransferase